MDTKRYCQCGCGGEVKTWNNGVASQFLRGHHMRKKGWKPPLSGPYYCQCGCGAEVLPLKNGHISKYIKGHHLKGTKLTLEYRLERTRNRWGREPTLSPYLEDTFVSFDNKAKRWTACVKSEGGKWRMCMHANAVYREHFGDIEKGYVVHHKDGKHSDLHDDRPENLMLLPDKWNLRFFPTLAEGFGVSEQIVTDCYLSVFEEGMDEKELFSRLCDALIQHEKRLAKEKAVEVV